MSSIELLTAEIAHRTGWLLGELSLSQRSMAERLGVAQTFISAVSRGRSMPSIAMLFGLQREFRVNLGWYVSGVGEPFTPPITYNITQHRTHELLDAVLHQDPAATPQIQAYLQALLDRASPRQQRAQAG